VDGNGLDTHGIRFGYHFLPYFNWDMNADTNILEYEYKMIPQFRILIRIFTQFNVKRISLNSIKTNKILVPRSSIAKANQDQITHLIISHVIVN
jgi:hypothetical protein